MANDEQEWNRALESISLAEAIPLPGGTIAVSIIDSNSNGESPKDSRVEETRLSPTDVRSRRATHLIPCVGERVCHPDLVQFVRGEAILYNWLCAVRGLELVEWSEIIPCQ